MRDTGGQLPRHRQFAAVHSAGGQTGGVQRRIGGKYLPMQFPQPRPGLSAELLDQYPASLLVGGQSIALATVAIQGQYQEFVQLLAERIITGKQPKLGDYLGVVTQVQSAAMRVSTACPARASAAAAAQSRHRAPDRAALR